MIDKSDEQRDAIHAALQENSTHHTAEGALLTGWVVVTEWMDGNGEKWLAKSHSPNVANWVAAGYHHEALYGDWPEP